MDRRVAIGVARALLFVVLAVVLGAGCAGCDDATRPLDAAENAGAEGDHVRSANLYELICERHPKSGPCKKAKDVLPAEQAVGAAQLLERGEYLPAKRMAEKAAAATGEPSEKAKALLRSENLIAG